MQNGSERNSELFSLPLKGSEGNSVSLLLFLFRGREFRVVSLPLKGSEGNSEILLLFLFHGTEFRDVFSSAEGFGREFRDFASISVPRNGIPRCFLFRGRVWNGIPRNSVPRNSRNSVGNNHLFRQFRLPRNFFLSEIPNPNPIPFSFSIHPPSVLFSPSHFHIHDQPHLNPHPHITVQCPFTIHFHFHLYFNLHLPLPSPSPLRPPHLHKRIDSKYYKYKKKHIYFKLNYFSFVFSLLLIGGVFFTFRLNTEVTRKK